MLYGTPLSQLLSPNVVMSSIFQDYEWPMEGFLMPYAPPVRKSTAATGGTYHKFLCPALVGLILSIDTLIIIIHHHSYV